ncbi:RNA polymerase sigma factor [Emticicia sp. BO119]|uniref:RNA polymerase sigma factor n=1 Tax=Emticicia sp. BO119 TaxID=2757768 RepID=UPI0015F0D47B|nr:RNA polymerase sigma factor [Emticicia sp. BO119]MBA4852917.1 RNA polymerase sigma factor [Emticicia sp. BO119]
MKNKAFKVVADEELVRLYIETQRNIYFEEIYDRYVDKVYRKCLSFVKNEAQAEDFTHDIFLRIVLKLGSFKEHAKFSTWLYSITYNYCMDQVRQVKRQAEVALDENFDLADDGYDVELVEMQSQGLKKALQKIDPDERAILLMKYQDDFSIKEISETFKITESAVKMRLMRTKEKIKKIYTENIIFFLIVIIKVIWFWRK